MALWDSLAKQNMTESNPEQRVLDLTKMIAFIP